jgi:hypothetical protein
MMDEKDLKKVNDHDFIEEARARGLVKPEYCLQCKYELTNIYDYCGTLDGTVCTNKKCKESERLP